MVRIKHRYIIAQLLSNGDDENVFKNISLQDILTACREKLSELYGDISVGLYGKNMTIKYFDSSMESYIFILRVPREAENQARLSLACVNHIKKIACITRTLGVTGSERTCKDKLKKLLIKLAELKFPTASEPLFSEEMSKISKTINQLDL